MGGIISPYPPGSGGGPPTGAAGGDLGGTYPNPTVVSVADVTTGVLALANGGLAASTAAGGRTTLGLGTAATQNSTAFDAAGAAAAAQAAAEAASLPLTGGTMSGAIAMGANKVTGLANGSGAQDAAAFGQIPTALPPNGAAGGDLSGSYPNPTVAKINGTAFTLPVSIANGGSGSGTALAASQVSQPGDPTGTASTTLVMMGLAVAYTPARTGIVKATLTCGVKNNTAVVLTTMGVRYGTGTAPIYGAAVTGTRWGGSADYVVEPGGTNRSQAVGFVDRLALAAGTTYWFDAAAATASAADTVFPTNISLVLEELAQ
jgi:hypothetical protein